MESNIICIDIDGTLTNDNFSRFGGTGRIGRMLWRVLRKFKIDRILMKRVKPNTLARVWLRSLSNHGYTIKLVTARLERYRELTTNWLCRNGIVYDCLAMRPRGVNTLPFKMSHATKAAGCCLYIEDTFEYCLGAAKQGAYAPLVLHCEDWRIVGEWLKVFITLGEKESL